MSSEEKGGAEKNAGDVGSNLVEPQQQERALPMLDLPPSMWGGTLLDWLRRFRIKREHRDYQKTISEVAGTYRAAQGLGQAKEGYAVQMTRLENLPKICEAERNKINAALDDAAADAAISSQRRRDAEAGRLRPSLDPLAEDLQG